MMCISSLPKRIFLALLLLTCCAFATYGADPGSATPTASEVSSQKTGAVLIYNLYVSSASGAGTQNTRVSMTNTSTTSVAVVHLFFVSSDGTVADAYICLTPVQTATFLASDVDPGVRGYLVAVLVDFNGCPMGSNILAGDAYVKLSTGHEASLPAEAFAAQFGGTLPGCNAASPSASLVFDGSASGYNRVPRTLAVEKLRSPADGNNTILVVNRIGGSLMTGASTTGALAGVLYDDVATPNSFFLSTGATQVFGTLSDTFPAASPVYSQFVSAGHTGWMKFSNPTADIGLLGAVLNYNPNSNAQPAAFTGGHNLRKLNFSTSNSFVIPVFPPSC